MITLYSLITTIIWTSFLCIIMFLCRRSTLFIRYFGVAPLLILFAACLLRLLIPIEFSFTRVIVLPEMLNPISNIFYGAASEYSEGYSFHIALIVWITVAIILLLRFTTLYIWHFKYISCLPSITTNQIDKIAKDVISEKDTIKITLYPNTTVPMICGFRKGFMLLPNTEYTDQELQLIITHEYTHFLNHDAYIRLIVELFCACFWWNPLVYRMKYDLDSILEIKCDMKVTQGKDKADVVFYADTLMRFSNENGKKIPLVTSEFCGENAIKQRFTLLFVPAIGQKSQKVFSVLTIMVLICAFVCSYLFIFQSHYDIEYDFSMAKEMTYVEENADGTYTLHYGDEYFIVSAKEYEIMIAAGLP